MTICDKIQTIGTTLQDNLNDRGVSCTFGGGTGESTVLDMVVFAVSFMDKAS